MASGESTALSPPPLIFSYKSEKSLCGTGATSWSAEECPRSLLVSSPLLRGVKCTRRYKSAGARTREGLEAAWPRSRPSTSNNTAFMSLSHTHSLARALALCGWVVAVCVGSTGRRCAAAVAKTSRPPDSYPGLHGRCVIALRTSSLGLRVLRDNASLCLLVELIFQHCQSTLCRRPSTARRGRRLCL